MKQIKIQDEIYQAIYHLDNQELKRLTSNDTLFEIENNFELNRGDIYQLVTITQKRVKKIRSFPENDVIMNIGNPQIEVEHQWLWTGERLKEMKIKKQEKTSIVEKYEIFQQMGWSYVQDGNDYSSGFWKHNTFGFVNNGGDCFRNISDAIAALERFLVGIGIES